MGPGNAPWILNREQKRDPKKQLVMLLVAEEGAWRRWEGAKGRGQLQSLSKVREKGGGQPQRERETGALGNFYSRSRWRHTARAASKERLEPKAHAQMPFGFASPAHFCKTRDQQDRAAVSASPMCHRLSLKSSPIPARRIPQPRVSAWEMKAMGTFLKDLQSLFLCFAHLIPISRAMHRRLFSHTFSAQNKSNAVCSLAGSC